MVILIYGSTSAAQGLLSFIIVWLGFRQGITIYFINPLYHDDYNFNTILMHIQIEDETLYLSVTKNRIKFLKLVEPFPSPFSIEATAECSYQKIWKWEDRRKWS